MHLFRTGTITRIINSQMLSLVCLAMNLLVILMVFASLGKYEIYTFTNTDTLYLPSIWKDVMIDGTGFKGWHLNGAPNFFPDMTLYFIIRFFISNWLTAIIVFSMVQSAIILTLSYFVVKTFIEGIPPLFLNLGMLLMLLIFYSQLSGGFYYHTYLFLSMTYHTGSYVMLLLSLLFLGRYLKNDKPADLAVLFIVMVLAVFNDRLYLFQFSFPSLVLVLLLISKPMRKKLLFFYSASLAAIIFGIVIFNLIGLSAIFDIAHINNNFLNWANVLSSFQILFLEYANKFRGSFFYSIVGLLVILSWISMFVLSVKAVIRLVKGKKVVGAYIMETAYCLFATVYSLCIFTGPALGGNYLGLAHDRYNVYFIFFNLFNWPFLAFKVSEVRALRQPVTALISLFLLFNIGVLLYFHSKTTTAEGLSRFTHYYPDAARDMDELAVKYDLKYGLADFWYAKYITMFSKTDLRVYSVVRHLSPYKHVTNENWFTGGTKGKYAHPAYTFLILNDLNREIAFQKLDGHIIDTVSGRENLLQVLLTDTFRIEWKDKFVFRDNVPQQEIDSTATTSKL